MIKVSVNPTFNRIGNVFKKMNLKNPIQKGIEIMAMDVMGEARKVTPVDTGRLRGSVAVVKSSFRATIAPHTSYATFVHEGTKRMKGRPFMKWGLEATLKKKSPVFVEIKKYVSAEVRKI